MWSVITAKIQLVHDKDPNVYTFPDWGSPQGTRYRVVLYLLPAVAGLSGGTLRLPNSFMTQCSGGRNVVYQTTLLLALPMLIAGIALKNPDVPFNLLLCCSILSGVGGGAFASSMSNISFFYPRKDQGYALGMNGGLGNLGVSISQLLAPVFMGSSFGEPSVSEIEGAWLYNAGWFWFCLCIPSAVLAFFWMNNIPEHGEATWWPNFKNFWAMEIVGLVAAFIAGIVLIFAHQDTAFSGAGGKAGMTVLLVLIACIIEHIFIWFLTPEPAKTRVRTQAVIFKEKHTYIMTFVSNDRLHSDPARTVCESSKQYIVKVSNILPLSLPPPFPHSFTLCVSVPSLVILVHSPSLSLTYLHTKRMKWDKKLRIPMLRMFSTILGWVRSLVQ